MFGLVFCIFIALKIKSVDFKKVTEMICFREWKINGNKMNIG